MTPPRRLLMKTQMTIKPPPFRALSPYERLEWQHAPLMDKSPIVLLTGSAGGGKSRVAGEKIHGFCQRYPGSTGLYIRKTRESIKKSIALLLSRKIVGHDPNVRYYTGDNHFEYANGSILIAGGMKDENQREFLRSIGIEGGVDICWIEEATQLAEEDFNEILARMRGRAAGWTQIILTTNPDAPTHWIYKRLIENGEAKVYYSSANDNPYNPPEYLHTLSQITGVQYDRLVLGLWRQAEGAVYDNFDTKIHVGPMPPRVAFKEFIAGVDWGFTNPGVIQVWGLDSDRRMYLVEEVYKVRELVAGADGKDGYWLNQARRLQKKWEIQRFECDPSEPAYIETFCRAGIHAYPADNDIRSGIDLVKARLNVQEDGKPRLVICEGASYEVDSRLEEAKKPTSTLSEFPAYVWPKGVDGKPLKEVPVDENNHGMDVVRYVTKRVDRRQGIGFG